MDFIFETEPLKHQLEIFMASRDMPYAAYAMDRGTGKSKLNIDVSAWLWNTGKINCLLVLAPNGVHQNWITDEIPIHMPKYISYDAAYYNGGMKAAERKQLETIWEANGRFKIVALNIESASNKKGKELIKKLLDNFNCMWIIDESHGIKTPKAQRTKSCLSRSKLAPYKRILTGTILTKDVLDLYTQFKFLHWTILKYNTFGAFKSHYAILERKKTNKNKLGYYDAIVGYKNEPELISRIAPYTFVAKKKDCLDLKPKTFETRPYILPKVLRKHYDTMLEHQMTIVGGALGVTIHTEEDLWAALVDDEGVVKAKNGMTALLKLQQITNGFIFDEDGAIVNLEDENSRIAILLDLLENVGGKVIIWARFKYDIRSILTTLRNEYGNNSTVAIFGDVDSEERQDAKYRFLNDDNCRFLVANAVSAGTGYTFNVATTTIYYSNDFRMDTRLQSEDRNHRIGQTENVLYIDIIAKDTLDERILRTVKTREQHLENLTDRIIDEQNIRSTGAAEER